MKLVISKIRTIEALIYENYDIGDINDIVFVLKEKKIYLIT